MKSRKSYFGFDGCGFLLMTCLVTCCFLAINSTLVQFTFAWLAPSGPEFLSRPRSAQFIMFSGPVVLLVGEWWLVDLLVRRLSPHRDEEF